MQRALIAHVLSKLPVHSAATAYQPGTSIRANAERHIHNGPILKYDFKEFFPSLRDNDWDKYCKTHTLFGSDEDIWISTRILFKRTPGSTVLRLAIGAPSSPQLSNILMHDFDKRMTALVEASKVTYTRYADDLTFSAPRTGYLNIVDKALRQTLKDMRSPRLTINEEKTVLATKKYRRVVTGLVLSNDGAVSLGRDRKRLIRATLHHAQTGKLSRDEVVKLAGILSFAQDVEPTFLVSLKKTYGEDLIARIKATKKVTASS